MHLLPRRRELADAAENIRDRFANGGLADLRPQPRSLLDQGPQRTVWRYARGDQPRGRPVLLVPPLAAPAICFDLRRGCSLAEHMIGTGRPAYLVDYGAIAFGHRKLGIEHWVHDVVPRAIRAVSDDADEQPVHLVGWCLGGIFSALTAASNPRLPIASITLVASPFDVTQVPLIAPILPFYDWTGGAVGRAMYRTLGIAPAPIVQGMYKLAALEKYLTKPYAVMKNLDDRDFLEQIEAVDRFMSGLLAYPGRTFGQLYHAILGANALAQGTMTLGTRTIDVRTLSTPVLCIAGEGDGIAPKAAVHHLGKLLPRARLESCPGGHLGVLTGRAARRTTWSHIDSFLAEHD